jgi:hypothetical protein
VTEYRSAENSLEVEEGQLFEGRDRRGPEMEEEIPQAESADDAAMRELPTSPNDLDVLEMRTQLEEAEEEAVVSNPLANMLIDGLLFERNAHIEW